MFALDLGPAIIVVMILLCYNPIMTAVFVNQRYDLKKLTKFKRWSINIAVCIFTIVLFVAVSFVSGMHTPDFIIIYFITITLLVILDRIARRQNREKK